MERGTGIPDTNRDAVVILPRARIDPTERSIPAAIMTKVIPVAIMALMDSCSKIFNQL